MGEVIDLSKARRSAEERPETREERIASSLEAIAKRVKENEERIKKERAAANESVLRSHRMKGKKK